MKNVLVVVDMQKDFIDGALGTKEAEAVVAPAVQEIQNPAYDSVIATMDTHGTDYLNTREGRFLPVEHCIKNTPGWQLNPEIEKELQKRNAQIIEKPTFGSVKLQQLICKEKPDSVTLIGLCTDICVISNAILIKSALTECDVSVIENETAGVTPAKKAAALETMRSCQITIR